MRRRITTHALAAALVVVLVVAAPLLGCLLLEGHWPGSYVDALNTNGGTDGLSFGAAVAAGILWTRYGSAFRVRGNVLRGRGRRRLQLDRVLYAKVSRRALAKGREELLLDVKTGTDQLAVRLGDSVTRCYYSPASLHELANELDLRPAGQAAAAQLRALADDPSVRTWPMG